MQRDEEADGPGTGYPTPPSTNSKTWQGSRLMSYRTDYRIDLMCSWMMTSRGLENDPKCSMVAEDSEETAYGPYNHPDYGRSALHEEG
jgi:hypothetical protein